MLDDDCQTAPKYPDQGGVRLKAPKAKSTFLMFFLTSKLFADDSLTKKASLNSLSVMLDYAAHLLVSFLITPLLVIGLGQYLFGAWQVLNRLVGYISASTGRPTQALKWALAKDQASPDKDQKQKYVGSAVIVSILFLPLMGILGTILVLMVPYWLKTPLEYFWEVRLCIGILVANLAVAGFAAIPMSVLQGENRGYKRMGLSMVTVLLGGGLVWLAVHFETGIVGVSAAGLVTTLLTGVVFFKIMKAHAEWFKISFPSYGEIRQFLGLSSWFLGWHLIVNLMTASDVVILGFLESVEAVTDYTLSKYVPETVISIIAMVNFGITPGLGGIIGSGNLKKAAKIRGEIMVFTWLITTALGTTLLLWNRSFLDLWVGPEHYIGTASVLLITVLVTQFVLIRSDASIIDLTLNLRRKVFLGFCSAIVAIIVSGILVGYFKLGVIGLCLGLIIGRMFLSVGYPSIVGRFLGVTILSQVRSAFRPALVTILFFSFAVWLESHINLGDGSSLARWLKFCQGAITTATTCLLLAFYFGLSDRQRKNVFRRIQAIRPGTLR